MNLAIREADFFLNYGELLSSITENVIAQNAFSGRCTPSNRTFQHVTIAPAASTISTARFERCDKLGGITFWSLFLVLSGSGVQDASRPRAGPSPPDAMNEAKRF